MRSKSAKKPGADHARAGEAPRALSLARALLSGLAAGCALHWDLISFFALAPAFTERERRSPTQSFVFGLIAGTGYHLVALHWLGSAFSLSGAGAVYSWSAWLLAATFGGCHWGFIWIVGDRAASRLPAWAKPWIWAAAWTGGITIWEHFAPWPCLSLAYTQTLSTRLLQLAPLLGHQALDYLVFAFNVAVGDAWITGYEGPVEINVPVLVCLQLAGILYGQHALPSHPTRAETRRIEILNPNVEANARWDANRVASIEAGFDELLLRPREKNPAMIFWHEGSLPRWIKPGDTLPEAAKWSKRLGAFQMIGAYAAQDGRFYNSVYAMAPDGKIAGIYRQRALIPLLESVPDWGPLRNWLGVGKNPLVVPLATGQAAPALISTPLGPAGVSICFESDFPWIAREDASRGARLIFEASNDAWFPGSWEPELHLSANVLRAAENRVTIVRASNGGVSAVIDPWGQVVARLGPDRSGRLDVDIPSEDSFPRRSFYARHGAVFGWLSAAAAALACAV